MEESGGGRVASGERNAEPTLLRYPPPLAFWQKRLQPAENKGSRHEKESKEKRRGGKLMKIRCLPRRHREHRAGQVGRAETHGVAEEGRDETGTRSAEPWRYITASVSLCQV